MPNIELRNAAAGDLGTLLAWQSEPQVIAAGAGEDWQWQRELSRAPPWREQLIAELDGRAIGFVQIIDPALEESRYWGEIGPNLRAIDIWLGSADLRGRGYGSEIMRQALARCFADARVTAVLVDPLAGNTRAHRFYQRLGFEFVETRRFGTDDCHVLRLRRERWRRANP